MPSDCPLASPEEELADARMAFRESPAGATRLLAADLTATTTVSSRRVAPPANNFGAPYRVHHRLVRAHAVRARVLHRLQGHASPVLGVASWGFGGLAGLRTFPRGRAGSSSRRLGGLQKRC